MVVYWRWVEDEKDEIVKVAATQQPLQLFRSIQTAAVPKLQLFSLIAIQATMLQLCRHREDHPQTLRGYDWPPKTFEHS